MELISWTDNLSVDNLEIDTQHQMLIEMINDLHAAMSQGKGRQVLGKIINGLVTYTLIHFKTEEKYFDQYGYPEAISHKKEHEEFVKKVSEFKDGFEKANFGLSVEIMNFLSDWLKNHIKKSDKKYAPFLKESMK